jgi:hypothetical protein
MFAVVITIIISITQYIVALTNKFWGAVGCTFGNLIRFSDPLQVLLKKTGAE